VNGLTALHAAALGLGLGAFAGMPVGVINMSIVDAATAGRRRFATGLGLGGAGADALQALVAFAGLGRVVTANPALVRVLAIVAAVAIIGYAVVAWRRRTRAPDPRIRADGHLARGIATGFVLTAPNPGALGAWVAVAAAVWPDATPPEAAVIAGGVVVGSAVWFTFLAGWVHRIQARRPAGGGPDAGRGRGPELISRIALILLIAIAVIGVVRTL
jgi:threonine/homoserine/homoserine lactone efflux protein